MSSNKLTLQDLINKNEIENKRVLVRVDFNVPIDENGIITDDNRILQSLPTIKAIIKNGGKCILMSHLGRPKGEKNPKYTLSAVAEYLSNVLNFPVLFSDDCISKNNTEVINEMQGGDVLLLENLRFYKEEEKNDPGFAEKLASYGDIYVNDAFGTAHRAHASTEGVTHFIKTCAAGYLMEKELKYLSGAIIDPARPLCAILGGSKISGKIDVLENLLGSADTILIGGGMMFTFYKAMGYNIGKSILEEDKVGLAKEILEKAKTSNTKLLLPSDVLMAEKFEQGSKTVTVKADGITSEYNDWTGVDIGPGTIKLYSDEILKSKTVVWNGPMGVFEIDDFAEGTMQIAKALADATAKGTVTIIGGGDSASAVAKAGLEKKISHVSTGGGASLEFLEGKKLPGVEALTDK
ncbi:MAG: phosphoglycerate kinase [Ignavibacteria bacterium]|nr:phosphoglycerate kinase [Ignavibacteria bacterium]